MNDATEEAPYQPFSFLEYNNAKRFLKNPRYTLLTSTEAFQKRLHQLEEGYRVWLTSRHIQATLHLDVSTEEGLKFLDSIRDTIKFIQENVEPVRDEDRTAHRYVEITGPLDTIKIEVHSKPRFRGTN